MTRIPRLARRIAGACALGGVLILPGARQAHASGNLVRCTITAGQVFAHDSYPRVLTGVFDEVFVRHVSFIHVFHATGKLKRVDTAPNSYPAGHGDTISVALPSGLQGSYRVIWYDTEKDDGGQYGGSFTFSVK